MTFRKLYILTIALLPAFPAAAQSLFAVDGDELRREVSSDRMLLMDNNLWLNTLNPSALSLSGPAPVSSGSSVPASLGSAPDSNIVPALLGSVSDSYVVSSSLGSVHDSSAVQTFSQTASTSSRPAPTSFGSAEINGDFTSGAYRRAMDPSSDYSFNFSAESYNYLKNIDLYGSFTFTQQTLKGKTWSENYEPYNGNPYIAGSPLAGNYSKQFFAFKVAASSKLLWHRVRFGVGFDYNVGDLSRYNDPRSRVQLADYSVIPGLVIDLTSRDRLGVSGTYRHRKEKMLKPVTKSESIDRYIYCTQKGVAEYSESGLLFFSRRYIGDYGGVELQYSHSSASSSNPGSSRRGSFREGAFRGGSSCANASSHASSSASSCASASSLSFLVNGGFNYRFDDVIGERKENPGNYTSLKYYGGFSLLCRKAMLGHKFSARASYTSGSAQECLQELVTETNDQGMPDSWWQTVMKNVRYRNALAEASLEYRVTGMGTGGYLWDVGIAVDAEYCSARYVLPHSSVSTAYIEPSLSGGGVLYRKSSNEIKMSGRIGWRAALPGSLALSSSLDEEKTTKIRDNVTVPDFEILSRNGLAAGLSLDYIFVTLKKVRFYCSMSTNQYYSFHPSSSIAHSSASTAVQDNAKSGSPSETKFRIWSSVSFGILY